MTVLQLSKYYPPYKGGIELVAEMITKSHRDDNEEVTVICFGENAEDRVGEYGEHVYSIKSDVNIASAPFNLTLYFNLVSMIRTKKITKVYVHLPNPFMHQLMLKYAIQFKDAGAQIIAVYHSDIVNQKILGPIYNKYFGLTSSIYDKFIVSSQILAANSGTLSGRQKSKVEVIPFCIKEHDTYQGKQSMQGNLLGIGRLVPYKGFDFLIKTINKTDYHLNIVGDGPLNSELKTIAGPNVQLLGAVSDDEKWARMKEADLLVISSTNKSEAYGMTIVEAFSIGLPVIAPNLGSGVNYLVQNEVTGLIYNLQDEKSLIEKIEMLKNDPELYRKLSYNCHQFYLSNLSYNNFHEKLRSIAS